MRTARAAIASEVAVDAEVKKEVSSDVDVSTGEHKCVNVEILCMLPFPTAESV